MNTDVDRLEHIDWNDIAELHKLDGHMIAALLTEWGAFD